MKRTLILRSEALADLTVDELRTVAGGVGQSGLTCPVRDCLSQMLTCSCPTL